MIHHTFKAAAAFVLSAGLIHAGPADAHSYGEALQKSILFYEAQQAGPLPEWNRIAWRGDSVPDDGADVGVDLRGGWFDAGDHVKFGFPMAATTTLLAWGGVDYREAYEASGQLPHLLNNLRFVNDYFINAHVSPNEFYGQVGLGHEDHGFWGPAEVVHLKIPNSRASMKIDLDCPGPDLAAETAAAMAASSMVFEPTDATYAQTLMSHAVDLYDFAEATTGEDGTDNAYSNCITDAQSFYNSTHGVYWDEMAWGAVWLWRATGDDHYLDRALYYYDLMGFETQSDTPVYTWSLSWNDKAYGVYVLLAGLLGDERFHTDAQRYLDHWSVGDGQRTAAGLAVVDGSGWGVNRYAANLAFLALHYADTLGEDHSLYNRYHAFGKRQIDYILGDNPLNLSYLIGYGDDYPINVHHRGSHGSWADSLSVPAQQRHELIGAVVAGPDADTNYTEDRGDYIMNEVAIDYNAGFTGAAAALYSLYGGDALPESEFPPAVDPQDDEWLIGASVNSSGSRHMEIRAVLQNRTTTPAQGRDDLYFRYFYDLSELYDAGYTVNDVNLTTAFSQASSVTGLHAWGDGSSHIYYAEVSFAGDWVYPGGQSDHRREVQFRAALPDSLPADAWDHSNDPSWDPAFQNPSQQYGAPATGMALYSSEGLLWGQEPGQGCGPETGINCPPQAQDLTLSTDYQTPVAVELQGTDSDGVVVDYEIVSQPANGSLSGAGAERTYSPESGFSGTDKFTYRAIDDDGAASEPATVTIQVGQAAVPSLSISGPGVGTVFAPEEGFELHLSVSHIDALRVDIDGTEVGEFEASQTVPLTAPEQEGDFVVTMEALGTEGQTLGISDSRQFTVELDSDPGPGPGEGQCTFAIQSEWGEGYVGAIVINNEGSQAIDGWQVEWAFTDGSTLLHVWNAELSGSNPYTASHLTWNRRIEPGQSVEFGFQVSKGSSEAQIPDVTGAVCE
ncbi:glycoside hydrolase family 9 protein [Marinimicrobium alkaliphilum]|uniref:glycoside hydrolase family 9 protein n=1 Tax=Marinimicrobium alkaliphilum TaxID=2202654 RepID=UPI001E5E0A10|nr:glycoside hydrolase family 9 protein [Marinimicrobium alkaliphilum]